jgi:hypothetical protein
MVRRTFLKISCFFGSALALFGIDLFKMTKDILAGEEIKTKITNRPTSIQTTSSLNEAIRSRDRNTLLSVIQKNKAQVAGASTQDKIEAIKIIMAPGSCVQNTGEAAVNEKAVAILLSKADRNPEEIVTIIHATVGKKWLSERILTMQDPDLKRICQLGLRTINRQ